MSAPSAGLQRDHRRTCTARSGWRRASGNCPANVDARGQNYLIADGQRARGLRTRASSATSCRASSAASATTRARRRARRNYYDEPIAIRPLHRFAYESYREHARRARQAAARSPGQAGRHRRLGPVGPGRRVRPDAARLRRRDVREGRQAGRSAVLGRAVVPAPARGAARRDRRPRAHGARPDVRRPRSGATSPWPTCSATTTRSCWPPACR